jgi:ABC-type Fe3+/spermidine/putrescine transport system ATPase subunit
MEVLNTKLSVRNMSKSFDGKPVLNDLNFDLMEGEFLSILGPSGCGKTTLLRILIGLEQADCGQILKGGEDISALPSAQRGMGIVFQNYALFPNMTVLQNVEYALTLRNDTKKDARKIALRTLEQVGLMDQMHKRPHQLSGGQQQRVAIARTLATNPDIILLDEPISALDVTNREIMKAELKLLQKKFHATMLFITHDQEEAFFLSDRIMVMNEGNVEQLDTPLEIYRNPASEYVKQFVVEQLDKKYADLLHYTGRDCYEK